MSVALDHSVRWAPECLERREVNYMQLYQHDTSSRFRFVLQGSLEGPSVAELEHAWTTAASILKGKELIVDVSGLTGTDEHGLNLLSRMRERGARLTADTPPGLPVLAALLGSEAVQETGSDPGCLSPLRRIIQRVRMRFP